MSSNPIPNAGVVMRAVEPRAGVRPSDAGTKLPGSAPAAGNALPAAQAAPSRDPGALAEAVSELNGYVQNVQRDLHFSIDRDSGRTVIKVIDSQSKELIRQIPPEEVITIARNVERYLNGSLLEVKA